jgi:hypothetical protein
MTYVVSRMFDQIKDALPLLRRALLRWFKGLFLKTMFDNYHPEQHYMRGSGPKSRSMDSTQDVGSKRA